MRLNFALLACLPCALAAPIILGPQDTSVIDRAMSDVQIALKRLATTVAIYNRNPQNNANAQQIQIDTDSQAATDALSAGANSMRRIPMISFSEAPRVVSEVNSVIAQLQQSVNAWVSAKQLIISAGGKRSIWEALKRQQVAAVDFATVLISRMPNSGLPGAMYLSIVQSAYQKGLQAFS
ncbi:hypothetical protein EJ08DRAFT_21822 [Tothia fuscella]|uniref:Uncharacterized protein n=1 Tax=Tothia fuscella TaxID=1048955 RepID=A0A9P4U0X0_9PEZI|nr:hypothetical protein EJ08DRAFT_21822 [Tothia fuscella]